MQKKEIIILFFILVLACFFRFWNIAVIPPGLYPDIAINGNQALDILETGKFKVFYPENNGREGLFMVLTSFSFLIFGAEIWAIRITSAVIGVFTVLGAYFLARELFNKKDKYVAPLTGFFMAISFWHTLLSRLGFRVILVPFCLSFLFYFLFRAKRTQKIIDFILAGLFLGLGFYSYGTFRFVVFMLTILLFYWFLNQEKKQRKRFIFQIFIFLAIAFSAALPLGIYFLQNPGDFTGRAGDVSIFSQQNLFFAFLKSFISHIAMFSFFGDGNWRHNLPYSPQLSVILGIFFLFGFVLCTKNIISSFKKRQKEFFSSPNLFLLSSFFIMLFPATLTIEGIPHALRAASVIPFVYIISSAGFLWVYETLKKNTLEKKLSFAAFSLLMLAMVLTEYNKYFVLWAKNPKTAEAFSENYVEIGKYLNSLPIGTKKYVIVNQGGVLVGGLPMSIQTIMFIERTDQKPDSIYLLPQDIEKIKKEEERPLVVVDLARDKELLERISQSLEGGSIYETKGFLSIVF